jgi:hypothetical protein
VNGIAPVPDAAGALHYRNEFLCNALSKVALSTTHVSPLRCSGQDPLDRITSSSPLVQRNRNLKSDTTASGTPLTSDAHERGDRVNSESEVEDGVERKMRGRWRPRKQRS